MTPADFKDANIRFTAPPDLAESQVMTIPGFLGVVDGGSVDGSRVCVVAWMPSLLDIEKMLEGKPVFISMLGGLAPHFLTMNFEEATHPK